MRVRLRSSVPPDHGDGGPVRVNTARSLYGLVVNIEQREWSGPRVCEGQYYTIQDGFHAGWFICEHWIDVVLVEANAGPLLVPPQRPLPMRVRLVDDIPPGHIVDSMYEGSYGKIFDVIQVRRSGDEIWDCNPEAVFELDNGSWVCNHFVAQFIKDKGPKTKRRIRNGKSPIVKEVEPQLDELLELLKSQNITEAIAMAKSLIENSRDLNDLLIRSNGLSLAMRIYNESHGAVDQSRLQTAWVTWEETLKLVLGSTEPETSRDYSLMPDVET